MYFVLATGVMEYVRGSTEYSVRREVVTVITPYEWTERGRRKRLVNYSVIPTFPHDSRNDASGLIDLSVSPFSPDLAPARLSALFLSSAPHVGIDMRLRVIEFRVSSNPYRVPSTDAILSYRTRVHT